MAQYPSTIRLFSAETWVITREVLKKKQAMLELPNMSATVLQLAGLNHGGFNNFGD
jgi:hypothetical protein